MTFVLVVDDEPHIAPTLTINVRARDHDVESAGTGAPPCTSWRSAPRTSSCLTSGCRTWTASMFCAGSARPPQSRRLSCRRGTTPDDKIEALVAGADDHVTKPWHGRVPGPSTGRRPPPGHSGQNARHGADSRLHSDFANYRATQGQQEVRLTPTQWRLLSALAATPSPLVTQTQLLRAAWGPPSSRSPTICASRPISSAVSSNPHRPPAVPHHRAGHRLSLHGLSS